MVGDNVDLLDAEAGGALAILVLRTVGAVDDEMTLGEALDMGGDLGRPGRRRRPVL
jgi:hypothetical protein